MKALRKLMKDIVCLIVYGLFDRYAAAVGRGERRQKTLLLVNLDGIGDYVLYRNFIKMIRESERYQDYAITLCGNDEWRDLAIAFDSAYIEDFIWINLLAFKSDLKYRFRVLRAVAHRRYEVALCATFSRHFLLCDAVIRATRAHEKIGTCSDLTNISPLLRRASDTYYTRLLGFNEGFEFDKYKKFFEHALGCVSNIAKPSLKTDDIEYAGIPARDYVVLFPGARGSSRRWAPQNFARLADSISELYKLTIVIAGAAVDRIRAHEIITHTRARDCIDMTGKTSLSKLAKVLAHSRLLISNDTCAIHLGVAVNIPVICISNGFHIGRFTYYPEDVYNNVYTIYPLAMVERIDKEAELWQQLQYTSRFDINSITVERVEFRMHKVLEHYQEEARHT